MFSNSLFLILVNIIISVLLIYGIHLSWNYIRDTYSKKKTKDLVNTQIEKYKKIIEEIQQPSSPTQDFIPEEEKINMMEDLTAFMNSL